MEASQSKVRQSATWNTLPKKKNHLCYALKNDLVCLYLCRLWTNMADQDFEVLQTALSPDVSESEEQVCCLNTTYP